MDKFFKDFMVKFLKIFFKDVLEKFLEKYMDGWTSEGIFVIITEDISGRILTDIIESPYSFSSTICYFSVLIQNFFFILIYVSPYFIHVWSSLKDFAGRYFGNATHSLLKLPLQESLDVLEKFPDTFLSVTQKNSWRNLKFLTKYL